jgi:hypothetical protein
MRELIAFPDVLTPAFRDILRVHWLMNGLNSETLSGIEASETDQRYRERSHAWNVMVHSREPEQGQGNHAA